MKLFTFDKWTCLCLVIAVLWVGACFRLNMFSF